MAITPGRMRAAAIVVALAAGTTAHSFTTSAAASSASSASSAATAAGSTAQVGSAAVAAVPPRYLRDLAGPGLADLTPVDVAVTATRYYALDVARYRIVAIDRATNRIVAQVGGSRGDGTNSLGAARAIAVDSAGNVYIADTPNARVIQYDASLRFLRAWGTLGSGAGQFTQVYGVAVGTGLGASGQATEIVYAIDGVGRIQKFTTTGALVGTFAPAVALNQPRMAQVNAATGDLWVVNARDREVVVLRNDGVERFRFGSNGTGNGQFTGDPRGIAISRDGTRAYVSDDGNHRIQVFTGAGAFVSQIKPAAGGGRLVDPRGLDVTSDGVLVVSDEWDFALKEFSTAGVFQAKLFGTKPPVGGVNSPRGLAVDPGGRVYVSDWWNQRVQRFNPDGTGVLPWGFRGTTSEPGSINFAWGLARQASTRRIFLANRESHEIEVFGPDGAFVTRWGSRGAAAGQLEFPQGVAFDPTDGTLVVTDSGNDRVQRFRINADGSGTFVAAYGSAGTGAGQLQTPSGVDVAADGTIWVADTRNGRVQKLSPGGVWTAYASPVGSTTFQSPWGVSVAPDGSIWVADSGRQRIVKANTNMVPEFTANGAVLGSGPLNFPYEIDFGPGGLVYVSDTFNNRVIVLQQ